MTREEALAFAQKELQAAYERANKIGIKGKTRYIEVLEMAIQALSQEPCDDAVSREAVLDALLDYWHDIQFVDGTGYDVFEDSAEVIKALPSVTHKSGKWTLMYEPKNMVVCSECEKCAYMYQDKTSAFCPNCGAKMESEE